MNKLSEPESSESMESTCTFEKLNDVLDLYRNIGITTSPEITSSSQFRDQVSCSFRPKVALLDSCGPRRTSNPRFLKNTSPCPVGIVPDAVAPVDILIDTFADK